MPPTARKPKKRTPKIMRTDPKQSARFIKAAQDLGLDEGSGDAFERAMDHLTKSKKSKSS
jgi:hypothetical protein